MDEREHVLKIFLWNAGVKRHFFRRGLQEPVVIDVADDELGCFTIIRVQYLLIQLRHQVLLQSLLSNDRVEKELAFFLILLRASAVAARLGHVIAPFLIQLGQLIELLFEFLIGRGGIGTGGRLRLIR